MNIGIPVGMIEQHTVQYRGYQAAGPVNRVCGDLPRVQVPSLSGPSLRGFRRRSGVRVFRDDSLAVELR